MAKHAKYFVCKHVTACLNVVESDWNLFDKRAGFKIEKQALDKSNQYKSKSSLGKLSLAALQHHVMVHSLFAKYIDPR